MSDEHNPTIQAEPDPAARDMARLRGHIAALRHHFDTVQIFASRQTDDGTVHCTWGDGNWFARYGQTREWLTRIEARAAAEGLRAAEE